MPFNHVLTMFCHSKNYFNSEMVTNVTSCFASISYNFVAILHTTCVKKMFNCADNFFHVCRNLKPASLLKN